MAALVGTVMGLSYNKMHGIACLAEELLAFQGCLCSMELPNFLKNEKNTTLEKLGIDGRIILKLDLKRNQLERHEPSGSV
jgi:hypothetical protein